MHEVLKPIVAESAEAQLSPEALNRMAVQWVAWVNGTISGQMPENLRYPSLAKPAELHQLLDRLRESEFEYLAPPPKDVAAVGDQMIDMLDKAANLVRKGAFDHGPVDLGTCWTSAEADPLLPPALATLLVSMANLGKASSAYCCWDDCAQLACRAADQTSGQIALETSSERRAPDLAGLATGRRLDIRYGEPITNPAFVDQRQPILFDMVVAAPPMGSRYCALNLTDFAAERFPERTTAGSLLHVRHVLWHTRQRAVVTVPNQLLFGSGVERQLREAVVTRGWLKAVIGMADGYLQNSNMGFAILVFDKVQNNQTVRFIDATDAEDARLYDVDKEASNRGGLRIKDPAWLASLIDAELSEGEEGIVSDIPINELAQHDYELSVNHYVLSSQQKRLQQKLDTLPTMKLNELATVIGHRRTFSSALKGEGEAMGVYEIGSADLPEKGMIRNPVKSTRICAKAARKYEQDFLRPHDIVLITKGSAGKIGLVPPNVPPPGEGGWMIGQTGVAIRITNTDHIDPIDLFTQLRASIGRSLFERIKAGSTIPLIRLGDLNEMPIFIPDNAQHTETHALFEREVSLQSEIDRRKSEQAKIALQFWSL